MARIIGLLSIVSVLGLVSYAQGRCNIPHAAFPNRTPVFFNWDGSLVQPSFGEITLRGGSPIVIGCPGKNNFLPAFGRQFVHARCIHSDRFSVRLETHPASNFVCKKNATGVARNTGIQCTGGQWREIGYRNHKNIIAPLLKVCYYEYEAQTRYSVHTLNGAAFPSIIRKRPSTWNRTEVSHPTNIEKSYERVGEKQTFSRILGSDYLANEYIATNGEYYLARGHLSPSSDFTFYSYRRLTFYYINAVPQWQIINNGNWRILEEEVRKMAGRTKRKYNVTTGSHEILMLNNNAGTPVRIYLAKSNGTTQLSSNLVPVPKYIWKIVQDLVTKKAIAFIVHNNPYLQVREPDLCPNICEVSEKAWYYHQWNTVAKGLLYCCEVRSFAAAVRNVPDVTATGILSHTIRRNEN